MLQGQGLMFASMGIVQETLYSFNQSTQEFKMETLDQQGDGVATWSKKN